jgi:dipeptidyl aminopeptidase/acylaminoacyl peptidase
MTQTSRFRIAAAALFLMLIVSLILAVLAVPDSTGQTMIAFMSDRDGNFENYIMGQDGSMPLNLTNHEAADGMPDWSAAAGAYAFISTRGTGDPVLYRMDADGSNQIALAAGLPVNAGRPIWSPTGEWIAFGSGQGNDRDVYAIDSSGNNLSLQLRQRRRVGHLCCQPQGWRDQATDRPVYTQRRTGLVSGWIYDCFCLRPR